MRYQISAINVALITLAIGNVQLFHESPSQVKMLKDVRFQLVVRYDKLFQIQVVSESWQPSEMDSHKCIKMFRKCCMVMIEWLMIEPVMKPTVKMCFKLDVSNEPRTFPEKKLCVFFNLFFKQNWFHILNQLSKKKFQ